MSARRLLVCAWVALGALVLGVACSISEDSDGGAGGGESAPDITTLCEEECIPLYPAGEVPYRNLRGCVFCGACFDVCTAELGAAICPDGGGDLGCSVQSTDCATCINGACALLQNPDTSFIGACAVPGQQCGDVVECEQPHRRQHAQHRGKKSAPSSVRNCEYRGAKTGRHAYVGFFILTTSLDPRS